MAGYGKNASEYLAGEEYNNTPCTPGGCYVRERGVKMPSFFGYMLWSVGILFPTFFIVDIIFL